MMKQVDSDTFYNTLPARRSLDRLTQSNAFSPLPDDWIVGVSDIVNSTGEIAAGRYKLINTVGAAVISAQINAHTEDDGKANRTSSFPFIFGGDGAAFALPASCFEKAEQGLAAVRRWALAEFGLQLRAALIPISEIRRAGQEVAVARFGVSQTADYAMFSGGGISWAEAQMKSGHFSVDMAPQGTVPDLEGLSCRWNESKSQQGSIVSLVVLPQPAATVKQVNQIFKKIVEISDGLERGGHPLAPEGPGYSWPPAGLAVEAHVSRGNGSLLSARLKLLLETFFVLVLIKLGLKAGDFEPDHYVMTVGRNADFRKFDDGLKMTLDIDPSTLKQLRSVLDAAQDEDIISYGLVEQGAAQITCIVPSVSTDDHVHFVDGAQGGYTAAAAQIKLRTSI